MYKMNSCKKAETLENHSTSRSFKDTFDYIKKKKLNPLNVKNKPKTQKKKSKQIRNPKQIQKTNDQKDK